MESIRAFRVTGCIPLDGTPSQRATIYSPQGCSIAFNESTSS